MARAIRIDELDTIHAAGVNWRPIRRTLGITGFGINAHTAARGALLLPELDRTGETLLVRRPGWPRWLVVEEALALEPLEGGETIPVDELDRGERHVLELRLRGCLGALPVVVAEPMWREALDLGDHVNH